jgi:30S ribosomal protein S31
MGKGDRRTRRGKIYNGSYGKKRPHTARKQAAAAPAPASTFTRPGKGR